MLSKIQIVCPGIQLKSSEMTPLEYIIGPEERLIEC